jgi:5'-nucleotidase
MTTPMKILVSNDDGVHALGIKILAKKLAEIAEITIIAPDRNRSGASNSLTLNRPVRIKYIDEKTISVEGTPTDCVHLAMTGLLKETFDMVVSGVNEGANLGDDIFYSGTVAAAMEGRFLGRSAMAISLVTPHLESCVHYYYETAAEIAKELVTRLQTSPLPDQSILNVNVPNLPLSKIQGYEITRLGKRQCADPVIQSLDPRNKPIYWLGLPGIEEDGGPGTDFHAIARGYVSITPVQLDLTNYSAFEQLAEWVK